MKEDGLQAVKIEDLDETLNTWYQVIPCADCRYPHLENWSMRKQKTGEDTDLAKRLRYHAIAQRLEEECNFHEKDGSGAEVAALLFCCRGCGKLFLRLMTLEDLKQGEALMKPVSWMLQYSYGLWYGEGLLDESYRDISEELAHRGVIVS